MNTINYRDYGLSERDAKTISEMFEQFPEIHSVFIFGSRAKGNYHSGSDIDLVVMDEGLSAKALRQLKSMFDESSLPYRVDVVAYHGLKNHALREHIERVGKAFYPAILTPTHVAARQYQPVL